MKFKWTLKNITLFFAIIIIILNTSLLFSYYNFYLSDKLVDNIAEAKDYNHENLYNITKLISNDTKEDAIKKIKKYVRKNKGYVTLKETNGKVVYQNKSADRLFSSTTIISIQNQSYELTYSSIAVSPGIKLIRNFVLYEIILISIVIILIFFISSRKLINPIDIITKDINEYRMGKIPYKRKMQKNMQKIQNSFVDMASSIEMEKENQNRIIASISHDIKTPLTSVIGYTDLLKNSKLSDEKKSKYVSKIYNKAIMMKEILEEFDDYQSCNIKETLKLEVLKLKDIKNGLKDNYEDELLTKNIKLKVKCDIQDKMIKVDYIKIKRVFSNIITNSVKHFDNKKGEIIINITSHNKFIIFEVADNGGGISNEKDLKRIFEPLYTTDPSRKISGLGLSICNQIINCHDGVIYAKNNNINGLSIIFEIPEYFNTF